MIIAGQRGSSEILCSAFLEAKKMSKPLIGIMPLVDEEKESYWMIPGYMKGVEEAGGIPVILPLSDEDAIVEQLLNTIDGLLFTGGQDVSPSLYGAEKQSWCGESCPERDSMELKYFKKAYKQDKPVLGICRGIQFINAAMGGTLYQDLEKEFPSTITHHQKAPYSNPVHKVSVQQNTPLFACVQDIELNVNSLHHQAVNELAQGLIPMAISEDGLVEAVMAKDKTFIWALQWHPELMHRVDEVSRRIFRAFIEKC